MNRPKAAYILGPGAYDIIYGPAEREDIASLVELVCDECIPADALADHADTLADVEVILSGWGAPVFNEQLYQIMPGLKALFYGAGSIRKIMTDTAWDRGLVIANAASANAVAVAEYTLSQILFCLKFGWRHVRSLRKTRQWKQILPMPGGYDSRVGIISAGQIGRLVCRHLSGFDMEVVVYDIHRDQQLADELSFRYVELDELFATCDVVSVHTPRLPATTGMINGTLISSMKEGASLINTARGAVINEPEMIDVLQKRPDLTAVLDVTEPEPPAEDSPLWEMDNVVLTPHIAGAVSTECRRMGRLMVDELRRYLAGQPLQYQVRKADMATMA